MAYRIQEVQDLNTIVDTLYKKGPTMHMSDDLSRICQPENDLYNSHLPRLLDVLLDRLPERVRNARNICVHANKDTAMAGRIVQKWRTPKILLALQLRPLPGTPISLSGPPPTKAHTILLSF